MKISILYKGLEKQGLSNYVVLEMVQPLKLSVFLLIESIIVVIYSILRYEVRSTIRLDNPLDESSK